jgi:hypothetical protein
MAKEPQQLGDRTALLAALAGIAGAVIGAFQPQAAPPATAIDPSWRFLGLQIARKTEFLALAAFVLSISGVLWQIMNFARGAVVRVFPSDQILMTSTDKLGRNYSGQENLLALAATMTYVNEGDVGHNAIIRRENIQFALPDRQVEHQGYQFVSSDIEDGKLSLKRVSEARPFPVNAGSATSHETLFTAWEIDCQSGQKSCNPAGNFVLWNDFVQVLKKSRNIAFKTSSDIYSGSPVSATCEVRVRDWEIPILENEQWLVAVCHESTLGGQTRKLSQRGLPK